MSDGAPLTSITRRLSAVDARDGRAVAATADVDPIYRLGDQLYVQPDARLSECFSVDEPVRMTRQEIAVARSHIEVWKTIATGSDRFVLVLEDDVWFRRGAPAAIDRGWRAALGRARSDGGPHLVYLSFDDAGGTAERADICDALFRPVRGLWFLSGYVLSRDGAGALLRAMPVVGPVDTWMNYRFKELRVLALSSPAILQRTDSPSTNSYSVLPYLARAGIVDASSRVRPPPQTSIASLLAWTGGGEREGLAMALSMLGLRVRVFDGDEKPIEASCLPTLFEVFDALVDPPLAPGALSAAVANSGLKFVLEANASRRSEVQRKGLPSSRVAVLAFDKTGSESWGPLCSFLGLDEPVQEYPLGAPRGLRVFRDDRLEHEHRDDATVRQRDCPVDDSPWVLPARSAWHSRSIQGRPMPCPGKLLIHEPMTAATPSFRGLTETFPGNLASFTRDGLTHDEDGAHLDLRQAVTGGRPYRSGAFVSVDAFEHGRFEAEIRAAPSAGLVTGFFLHRNAPRQEIDIELVGSDPRRMLVNVYFNPGDEGAQISFGYRGAPCRIDLDFDATLDFHVYAIEWWPGRIAWSVDGRIVHERVGWEPTPLPHLPMRLHANLWAPRSDEFAGRVDASALPSRATFKNLSVRALL